MHVVSCGLSALSVAILYYSWRGYYQNLLGREQMLRERVACMLWASAGLATE